ncbi:AlpA family phage regulatory protein [Alisedimentitalea sp. MJ-SS2]|uniref:helix-turn-helix transcriptional regulator n=1 Tax=Aliisedimentitalea sp. MJ-SS2 TaxID=3049795 RepID=UPI00290C9083|nr:AlpA family phage regulatory protein [Alisedimentitalea sp. MJ-SS2]MDU8929678.1 AlpA family phage regulatory protein [Alisedimentitalea sp. MJ-SS2]
MGILGSTFNEAGATMQYSEDLFLSDAQIAERYNINRVTVWRWLQSKPRFPKPVALSERVRRWRLSEIIKWEATCSKVTAQRESNDVLS